MNKTEFIADVHKRHKGEITCDRSGTRITLDAVTFWTELILQELRRCIIENDEVNLYGLGKFGRAELTDRELVTPEGRKINVNGHRRLKFVPSYHLKEAIARELTYEQFQDMVAKYKAVSRGEYMPGYYIKNRKLYEGSPEDNKTESN